MRNFVIYYHCDYLWDDILCRSLGHYAEWDHPDGDYYTNLKVKRVL